MRKETVALVILAGGESSRFGCSKALFKIEGRPMILRVIDALKDLPSRTVLEVAPGESAEFSRLLGKSIIISEDDEGHRGPLFGLSRALRSVSERCTIVVPCDVPFISSALFELLFQCMEEHQGAVPVLSGYPEPMISVYLSEPLKVAVEKAIIAGETRFSSFLDYLDYVAVPEEYLLSKSIDKKTLTNLNRPKERANPS